jgi:hypothetical protein
MSKLPYQGTNGIIQRPSAVDRTDTHNRLCQVSRPGNEIVLYDRKRAAKTTPITENPETVRAVASEAEL